MIVFWFVILERIVCFSSIQLFIFWTDWTGCFSGYNCLFFKRDLCVYLDNCFLDRHVCFSGSDCLAFWAELFMVSGS